MNSFSALAFLGAMAIFMYGIRLSRVGVQLLAGDRLKVLIASMTENRLMALITGIVTTLIFQSSNATTVMLVGFAASGAMTLTQAMGVILGADIGATFVILLFTVKHIADYALLLLVGGVFLEIISGRRRTRYVSMVIMGFGFVFFGIKLMIESTISLRNDPLLTQIFTLLAANPGYAFVGAVAFTALVQNSATTLGITIALAFSGVLDLREAIPIVLGANVGTCAGSILYSLTGGAPAKRVALSHLLFKVTGAALVLIFLDFLFSQIQELISLFPTLLSKVPFQIALVHILFNLALSILFLPFVRQGSWLIRKLVPEPYFPEAKPFGPKYLDPKSLETPPLAFASARREILRMSEIAAEMFRQTIDVFDKNDVGLMRHIEDQDDKVDILDRSIKFYLAKISQEGLTPTQSQTQLSLVAITSDLEEICDIINKNILELANKKIEKHRQFSEEGWDEIQDFHTKIYENFQLTLSCLAMEDEIIARKMARHEKHLALLEEKYREGHLKRLHKGLKETIETSSIHLDLLANFRRINSKLTAILIALFPKRKEMTSET